MVRVILETAEISQQNYNPLEDFTSGRQVPVSPAALFYSLLQSLSL